jgi:hypothetical protein
MSGGRARPGSAQAAILFEQGTARDFARALDSYEELVRMVGAKKKIENEIGLLNRWWMNDLPKLDSLHANELSKCARFKMTRGKMRPLQKLVDSNAEAEVGRVSEQAFLSLRQGKWKKGVEELSELKGVGVATATFIACRIAPQLCPFMADEALEGCGYPRDYSMKVWEQFRRELVDKAARLNEDEGAGRWSAEDVGRSLWCAAMMSVFGIDDGENDNGNIESPTKSNIKSTSNSVRGGEDVGSSAKRRRVATKQ